MPAETKYVCSCACGFPDAGIAAEHVQWVHPEAYEPGNLQSLEDAIDRMIVTTERQWPVSNIIYKTENCYPDLLDLERVLRAMPRSCNLAGELFQDFAVTFDWFRRVLPWIRSHGKHGFVSVLDVKRIVEEFVGHGIQEGAFLAACLERGLHTRNMDSEIKVPCLDRVMDVLPEWNAYVRQREK